MAKQPCSYLPMPYGKLVSPDTQSEQGGIAYEHFHAYKHMLGVLVGARVGMWRSNGEELANHWFTVALCYSKASGLLALSRSVSAVLSFLGRAILRR